MGIITIDHIFEAANMFARHIKVRGKHFTPQGTSANKICTSILKQLYTGYFYQTSLGNYPHFYSRDFGMVAASLISLGKQKEVVSTLDYALTQYEEYGSIKTFITIFGKPVDFPNVYSPDSFAYILYALSLSKDKKLIKKFSSFLQKELDKFYSLVVDKKNGLPIRKKHFGGMRDYSKRDASCYDAVMCAVVQREAQTLGLKLPFKKYNYKKLLVDNYWTGSYFKDDLSTDSLTADANIYPFWLDVITDKKLLEKTVKSMRKAKLDKPFPVRYVSSNKQKGKTIFTEFLVKDWESTAIWPMSALPYIDIVSRVDKLKAAYYLSQYTEQIEKYKTFIEVYTKKGVPYKSLFFSADEGMIWCANYLHLDKLLK